VKVFDNLHLQEEKEMDFLRQCNELMQQNQVILKEQLGKAEEKSKLADHEKDSRIQELQVPSHLFLWFICSHSPQRSKFGI